MSSSLRWLAPAALLAALLVASPAAALAPQLRTKITSAPPETTSSREASFEFTSSRPDSRFECRLDGGGWEECDSPHSYSDLSEGRHTFEVRAVSNGEADDTPASHRWKVETAPSEATGPGAGSLRSQDFDSDPDWEEQNNRLLPDSCPTTAQDFGYSATTHADSSPGEIGGVMWNSYTPAYFGKALDRPRDLSDSLSASGKLWIESGSLAWRGGFDDRGKGLQAGGVLFGFFNGDSRDWRTPNSLVLRLEEADAPGRFAVGVEYATESYHAFGQWLLAPGDKAHLTTRKSYSWNLRYEPSGAGGQGRITFSIEGVGTTALDLQPGHKGDGAVFDRFGMLNRMIEGNEATVYFDDLAVNGKAQKLGAAAPAGWEASGNRDSFEDCVVDDHHDFGYTGDGDKTAPAHAAGGVIWRTEASDRDRSAHYADRIGPLDLDQELYAEGTVRLDRASSDTAVSFGFFKSGDGELGERVPHNFVGIDTDGPSDVGFYFRPVLRSAEGDEERPSSGPMIVPDGRARRWTLHYKPDEDGGATLVATLDGKSVTEELSAEELEGGATLDRFGIRNVTVGGHAQIIYLDDLRYTADPAPEQARETPSPDRE